MTWSIVTLPIDTESDVVAVRQRARRIAELLGFERQDQTRIATAVSEIARNAFGYAGGGRAEFMIDPAETPQLFAHPHQRQGQRHRRSAKHSRRPIPLAERHGTWPGRRAPADGSLQDRHRARQGHVCRSRAALAEARRRDHASQAIRHRRRSQAGQHRPIRSRRCASRTAS